MRPAAQWLDLLEKKHFVLTEEYIKAIQRDALESAARYCEPATADCNCCNDIRALKPER